MGRKDQCHCLKATPGRYGGTFAHPDIAFEFGLWISPEFKIYLVKEFRRLNVRDQASLEQLVVLSNLESLNSVLIRQEISQPERLQKLNDVAITQMRTLLSANNMKQLK